MAKFQKGTTARNTGKTHFRKGHVPWNKGLRGLQDWHNISGLESRENGFIVSAGGRKNMSEARKRPELVAISIKNLPDNGGENHPNWKGGISREYREGYYGKEHKEWRKMVFERDNYACQECGNNGCYITAHHKKSWAKFPELRFNTNNGVTLCENCHSKTDNYKGRGRITQ